MALETHQYRSEQQITMKLMKRKRGSTYIMPRMQWTERDGKPHNIDGMWSSDFKPINIWFDGYFYFVCMTQVSNANENRRWKRLLR